MTSSTAPSMSSSTVPKGRPDGGTQPLYTNVQRFSIHDGGGIRTVVFMKGCPFRCPWCCNPENLSFKPEEVWHSNLCIHCSMAEGADGLVDCPCAPAECPTAAKELLGTPALVDELMDVVLRDRIFYEESDGGVTLSGGECLAGPTQHFTRRFLKSCKQAGLNTAIETTLAVPLRHPARLAAVTDTFLIDFKIADRRRSLEVTGIDPKVRDANLAVLLEHGAHVVARMPIIPGYTDGRENVLANVRRITALGIDRADVLPFHQMGASKYEATDRPYAMGGVRQLHEEDVAWVVGACEDAGLTAVVHGE